MIGIGVVVGLYCTKDANMLRVHVDGGCFLFTLLHSEIMHTNDKVALHNEETNNSTIKIAAFEVYST